MSKLNIYQLRKYANEFLKKNYGFELTVPLEINARLSSTQGWFKYTKRKDGKDVAKKIELSKFLIENNTDENVLSVLRHELIHYALFMKGLPYEDGKPTFEKELVKHCAVSQSNIKEKGMTYKKRKKSIQVYGCERCGNDIHLSRRLQHNGKYHTHASCGGCLIDKGKIYV